MKAKDFDHPIVFLFSVSLGVIAIMALIAWVCVITGFTGPLSLVKGGASK